MRRWSTRILICLLFGAVTTVAVAWGLALSIGVQTKYWPWDNPNSEFVLESGHSWLVDRFESAGHTRIIYFTASTNLSTTWLDSLVPNKRLLVSWGRIGNMGDRQVSEIEDSVFVDDGFGLPFRALWAGTDFDSLIIDPSLGGPGGFVSGIGASGATGQAQQRVLPYGVIWPGFLTDTLFFGAIWFAMIFGFAAARRGLRRKRGLCPQCAYDLRGDLDAGCPECGWNRAGAEL